MGLLDYFSRKALQNIEKSDNAPRSSIYDIAINRLDGTTIKLSDFKGKFLLIVNVASKCGFTPQYRELEKLFQTYKGQLMVIGVPCNQFGAQEPGSPTEIKSFCERNYGVSFVITEKTDVKGNDQHMLYQWLTHKTLNGKLNSTVRWNFQKYLVSPKGHLIDFYYSTTPPLSKKITKHLTR